MKNSITKLIMFSGSAEGKNPQYKQDAIKLGQLIGTQTSIQQIYYGGGFSGLMGAFAAAAARAGLPITGVRIRAFINPDAPPDIIQLYRESFVDDLPKRKGVMLEEGEAAVVLPGGIGTFDELWEIVAKQDVKFHANPDAVMQPVILLNTNGYYD